uniref:hypothetical protein n=1 Tax=Flavobacterium sp. TaxID=239 RepID=UPI0040496A90
MPNNTINFLSLNKQIFLFFFLFFFLLSPYLAIPVIGNTGMLSLIIFSVFNIPIINSFLRKRMFVFLCLSAFFLASYACLLSLLLKGDSPFYLFKIFTSLVCYLSVGFVLYRLCIRGSINGTCGNELIIWFFKMILLIVVLNSLIIIISQFNPALKITLESYLQAASNIDYESHEWRSRGLASAGGASLSIFHSIGILLAFSMAINKKISYLIMILSVLIIFFSMIFIGRSGLIFTILGVVVSILINVKKFSLVKLVTVPLIILIISFILLFILQENITASVLEYNLFSTFDFNELKNDEGLLYFFGKHFEIPNNPFILLFGLGSFESVNNLGLYSDSGYMRIFYYFGFPVGLFFFIAILFILKIPKKYNSISPIYIPVLVVLFVANIKEPVLYTGYSARLVFVISGFLLAEKLFSKSVPENFLASKNT